jgi:hypothetical protein
MTVRRLIQVESRRFIGDFDVFDQCRDDLVALTLVNQFRRLGDIQHLATPLAERCGKDSASP